MLVHKKAQYVRNSNRNCKLPLRKRGAAPAYKWERGSDYLLLQKSGQSEPAAAVPALAQALLLPAVIQWQNLQKSFPCSPVLPSVCFPAERTLAAMAGRTEIRSASLRLSRKPAFWHGVLQSVCAGAVAGIVCSSASTSFHHVSAKSKAIRLFKVQRSYHPYCTGPAPFLQGKLLHSQRRLQKYCGSKRCA